MASVYVWQHDVLTHTSTYVATSCVTCGPVRAVAKGSSKRRLPGGSSISTARKASFTHTRGALKCLHASCMSGADACCQGQVAAGACRLGEMRYGRANKIEQKALCTIDESMRAVVSWQTPNAALSTPAMRRAVKETAPAAHQRSLLVQSGTLTGTPLRAVWPLSQEVSAVARHLT